MISTPLANRQNAHQMFLKRSNFELVIQRFKLPTVVWFERRLQNDQPLPARYREKAQVL